MKCRPRWNREDFLICINLCSKKHENRSWSLVYTKREKNTVNHSERIKMFFIFLHATCYVLKDI